MPPKFNGKVYGGFIFNQDAIVEWGRRLGGVVGEDMEERLRKTRREFTINSFIIANDAITKQLEPHGVRLEPVGPDTGNLYVLCSP